MQTNASLFSILAIEEEFSQAFQAGWDSKKMTVQGFQGI